MSATEATLPHRTEAADNLPVYDPHELDYREWLRLAEEYRESREGNKIDAPSCRKEYQPHLEMVTAPQLAGCILQTPLEDALEEYPWARIFVDPNQVLPKGWIIEPLRVAEEDGLLATKALMFITKMYGCVIMANDWWKSDLGEAQWGEQDLKDVKGSGHPAKILNSWAWHVPGFKGSQPWRLFCHRISQFCIEAGLPQTLKAPVDNLAALRTQMTARLLASKEEQLREEIKRLQAEVRINQRVIACLAFRQVAENLPGPRERNAKGREIDSATGHWQKFWKASLKTLQDEDAPPNHPLRPLLKLPKSAFGQAVRWGDEMYGNLSTEIHGYSKGGYDIHEDQWGLIGTTILKALTPEGAQLDEDGGIDWMAEKERFL